MRHKTIKTNVIAIRRRSHWSTSTWIFPPTPMRLRNEKFETRGLCCRNDRRLAELCSSWIFTQNKKPHEFSIDDVGGGTEWTENRVYVARNCWVVASRRIFQSEYTILRRCWDVCDAFLSRRRQNSLAKFIHRPQTEALGRALASRFCRTATFETNTASGECGRVCVACTESSRELHASKDWKNPSSTARIKQ